MKQSEKRFLWRKRIQSFWGIAILTFGIISPSQAVRVYAAADISVESTETAVTDAAVSDERVSPMTQAEQDHSEPVISGEGNSAAPSESDGVGTTSPEPDTQETTAPPDTSPDLTIAPDTGQMPDMDSNAPSVVQGEGETSDSNSLNQKEEEETMADSGKDDSGQAAKLSIPDSLPSLRTISVQACWKPDGTEKKPEFITCTVFSDQSEAPVATCSLSEADVSEPDDGTIMWSKTLPDHFPVYSREGDIITYRIEAVDSDGQKYTASVQEGQNLYQNLNIYVPSESLKEGDDYLLADGVKGTVSLYKSLLSGDGQPEKISAGVLTGDGFSVRDQDGNSYQSSLVIQSSIPGTNDSAYASALNQVTWTAQKDAAGTYSLINRASSENLTYPLQLQDSRYVLFHKITPKEMPIENAESKFLLTTEENPQDGENLTEETESDALPIPMLGISRVARLASAAPIDQAPDVVGNVEKANEWQIVSQQYAGTDQSYKTGYDIDNDGSKDIFYQKNVIPTGIENEFRVYMGITKRMTWDELLAESDFAISNSNGYHSVPIGTLYGNISRGNGSWLYAGKGSKNLEATVNYHRGGKIIHTYKGWYHYTTAPTASNGTGFIYLKSLGQYLLAARKIALSADKNGGSVIFDIDLDAMARQNIYFSVDDIVVDSVQDQMGSYITYEKTETSDGETGFSGDTLTWTPVSNGVSGIQVLENSGLTGYHYNIHQMVYDVHLKAEQEGFQSCAQNMDSKVGDPESYQVNQQAVLKCHIGSSSGSPAFQVPYVRGLLYDLEFRKIVKDTQIPLKDISFTVTRQTGGNTAAEQLEKTDRQTTDSDGWIKFHNLPWGNYSLQELAGKEGSFQSEYLDESGLDQPVSVQIGKVINESALSQDHGSGHSVDRESDVRNMLVLYNGTGIFENSLNTAKITVRKVVKEYDTLPDDLKNLAYPFNIISWHLPPKNPNPIYEMPKPGDTELKELEQDPELHHGDAVEYTLVVPKSGNKISVLEQYNRQAKNRMIFDSVKVEKNAGSTDFDMSELKNETAEWQTIPICPGNDLSVTYTNTPIGYVKIKKVVDNSQAQLAGDAFIINVTSAEDQGKTVNAQLVLSHGEESGWIRIEKTTTLRIDEILPKEYSESGITVDGGGTLEGDRVAIHPGEVVEITVHNQYTGKPFFHASDAVKNRFHPNLER